MRTVLRNARSLFLRKIPVSSKRLAIGVCLALLITVVVLQLSPDSDESPFVGSSFKLNFGAQPIDDCEADLVHISLTDDISQVAVVWASVSLCQWHVAYGRTQRELARNVVVSVSNARLTIDNGYGTRFWYRALLTELAPGAAYKYLIARRNHANKGKTFSFRSMKAGNMWNTRLMLYGDLNLASGILPGVVKEGVKGYDAVFHVGDIGVPLDGDDGLVGDTFLTTIEPLTASVPYMVVPGDHETTTRFAHYRTRFSVPGVPWPMPSDRTWYSVDIGMVHVVAINTEVIGSTRYDDAAAQLAWLKRDLQSANANRSYVPWVVVLGHRPFYTNSRQPKLPRDFGAVEALFYRYNVDLVVQSHAHLYERTWPVYRGRNDGAYSERRAPVYVTVGSPGYNTGAELLTARKPRWSAAVYHDRKAESFGRLTVLGPRKLLWQQVSPAYTDYPLDEFTLE